MILLLPPNKMKISIYFYYKKGIMPMCHATRTPPSPDFVVCGLLHLTLFGKSQNVTQSFEVSTRYYKCLPVLCKSFALNLVLDGLAGIPKTISNLFPLL